MQRLNTSFSKTTLPMKIHNTQKQTQKDILQQIVGIKDFVYTNTNQTKKSKTH